MPAASANQAQSLEVDDLEARLAALMDDTSSSHVQKNSVGMSCNTSEMSM